MMCYFGPTYRQNDSSRQDIFVDQADIDHIYLTACIGSVALLPFFSQLVSFLVANKLDKTGAEIKVIKRCLPMRILVIALYLISNISTIVLAIYVSQTTPTVNQHVLSSAIFASFVLATIVSNVIYSLKCTYGGVCMTP